MVLYCIITSINFFEILSATQFSLDFDIMSIYYIYTGMHFMYHTNKSFSFYELIIHLLEKQPI